MFKVSNIRTENKEGWAYLLCDFEAIDCENPFPADTIWVAVEEKNADMLTDQVYDPFVLIPLIMGIYYGQDVYIDGNISPRLYHNINHYLCDIFSAFAKKPKVSMEIKGLDVVKEGPSKLIGTGISCGVDSLTTIYDNYIMETDPNYRINSFFFTNHGSHGDFEDANTVDIWMKRAALNKKAADELGLPMYLINSNFHAYTHNLKGGGGGQRSGYLALYSCILALQKYVRRYLIAGNLSYDEIAKYFEQSRDFDISEYCESYMPHLVSTERIELVIDGCQYTRSQKTEYIRKWEFAQKYLNVCVNPKENGENCSCCQKCMWTLIPLEAMGGLNDFKNSFDINKYMRYSKSFKKRFVYTYGKDAMQTSIVDYAREKGMKMPRRIWVVMEYTPKIVIKRIIRKVCKRYGN